MSNEATQVVILSGEIQDIVEHRDEMTQSDYQACLEAVIMKAIQLGKELEKALKKEVV